MPLCNRYSCFPQPQAGLVLELYPVMAAVNGTKTVVAIHCVLAAAVHCFDKVPRMIYSIIWTTVPGILLFQGDISVVGTFLPHPVILVESSCRSVLISISIITGSFVIRNMLVPDDHVDRQGICFTSLLCRCY